MGKEIKRIFDRKRMLDENKLIDVYNEHLEDGEGEKDTE